MRAIRSIVLLTFAVFLIRAAPKPFDWVPVAEALGRAGAVQAGDVYKVGFPRSDLAVTLDGVSIKPALALGSWIAFKESGGGKAMTMGDLVLLPAEVNPVIAELQKGGIEQSALHNHLIDETPRVMYMHFSGHGDAVALARTLHTALSLTATPMGPASPPSTAPLDLPVGDLDRIIGHPGKANGGVDQFSVPRAERITEHGMEIPPSMGTATAVNFQPLGEGRAAITGDFVMIASEVNPVIRALQKGGVRVTAIHSHMLEEQPRLFFMHFWAAGDAIKLATTVRSALDQMHTK
jgi:hypothetical protein